MVSCSCGKTGKCTNCKCAKADGDGDGRGAERTPACSCVLTLGGCVMWTGGSRAGDRENRDHRRTLLAPGVGSIPLRSVPRRREFGGCKCIG